jgi:hypothetical protein
MSNYWAESFYRATIRQSVDDIQTCPFTLKVSKIPTLTTWLLTISSNTANEEILEYNGVDGTALTITVVKRGISPSSQALTTNGTDYNNVAHQNPHSQNDSIRADVTHLHIIQDYGNLQAQINTKVNTIGGTRTGLWNAVQTLEVDVTWVEVKKAITAWTTITSIETIRKQKADWTYEDVPFSFIEGAVATLAWWATTFSSYDSGIVSWDAVWDVNWFLTKCVTELASSINLNAGTVVAPSQVALDNTRVLFVYSLTNVVKAVVGTLSGNTFSLWTVVDLFTW